MTAEDALESFLRSSLRTKHERLSAFARSPKNQSKFFNALYHDLGSEFASSVVVDSLPDAAWCSQAFAFVTPGTFGELYSSLRTACESVASGEGALFVTTDAAFGVYCDHHEQVASRVLVVAKSRRAP